MYKILDLKRLFSTFQETVWSLLKNLLLISKKSYYNSYFLTNKDNINYSEKY